MNESLGQQVFEKDVLALFQVEKIEVYLLIGEFALRHVSVDVLLRETEGHVLKGMMAILVARGLIPFCQFRRKRCSGRRETFHAGRHRLASVAGMEMFQDHRRYYCYLWVAVKWS